MVRYFLILFTMLCFGLAAFGVERSEETPEERARRVRVALAVSASAPIAAETTAPAPPAPDPGCGRCTDDLEDARRASRLTGKPIVLFVSVLGCEGRAKSLPAEVLAVRSTAYTRDGKPATEPRVLVLMPSYSAWEPIWLIPATLPGTATAEAIGVELEKTRTKPAPVVAQAVPAPVIHAAPPPPIVTFPQFALPGARCSNCK